jgi:hypothetical protein
MNKGEDFMKTGFSRYYSRADGFRSQRTPFPDESQYDFYLMCEIFEGMEKLNVKPTG